MLDMIRTLCVLFVYLLISLLCNLVKFNYSVCLYELRFVYFTIYLHNTEHSHWDVLLLLPLLLFIKIIWWFRMADTVIYSRSSLHGTLCDRVDNKNYNSNYHSTTQRTRFILMRIEWLCCTSSCFLMCLVVTLTITAYWIRALLAPWTPVFHSHWVITQWFKKCDNKLAITDLQRRTDTVHVGTKEENEEIEWNKIPSGSLQSDVFML